MKKICYLAPQLTALESTFVYEELFALERRGLCVIPVSVSRAENYLIGHDDLLRRTHYLYNGNILTNLLNSVAAFIKVGYKHRKGLKLLLSDMWALGPFSLQSWKLAYQYIISSQLAMILLNEKCDHLHVHFAHISTQIAMYAAAMASVPFTIMAHANDIFERGLLLKEKSLRAEKMLTISNYNCSHLVSAGVPKDKLAVVRCGVSFQSSKIRTRFKEKENYRIGTLARLVEKKGIDDLLQALAILRDLPYRLELTIAGSGPLRSELESLVSRLGLKNSVSFEGSLDHNEVTEWMRSIDIFVLACKQDSNGDMDGIPVVLMEAMSQSVPVISTRLSGIPELIVDEQTGLLSEQASPKEIAINIERYIKSPSLCTKLSNNAIEHINREFGQDINIDRLLVHFGMTK
ncbi:MAG: glycosyltransferase family 4 protein [Candidatus Sedimenticola sp. (ex Thyasira tokunagai)]